MYYCLKYSEISLSAIIILILTQSDKYFHMKSYNRHQKEAEGAAIK